MPHTRAREPIHATPSQSAPTPHKQRCTRIGKWTRARCPLHTPRRAPTGPWHLPKRAQTPNSTGSCDPAGLMPRALSALDSTAAVRSLLFTLTVHDVPSVKNTWITAMRGPSTRMKAEAPPPT